MKEVVFYYDVVCPFAYMASRLIEGVARRNGAKILWKPVLLGGLYKGTQAPQGAAGSAYDAMSGAKIKILADDLKRMRLHFGINATAPSEHPIRTLNPMRLLAAAAHLNEKVCVPLTHKLFGAYWVHNEGDHMENTPVALKWTEQGGFPPEEGWETTLLSKSLKPVLEEEL